MRRNMPENNDGPAVPVAELALGRSRTLLLLVVSGHVLAAAAVWLAALPPGFAFAASVVLLCSTVVHARRHAGLPPPQAIVALVVDDAGAVRALRRDGGCEEGRILPSTFVAPWLTILRFRAGGHAFARSVLLTADNCEPAAFRRLRVALCWRLAPSAIAPPPGGLN